MVETDLDLGNYERCALLVPEIPNSNTDLVVRYLGIELSLDSNMTTGKIYKLVIV